MLLVPLDGALIAFLADKNVFPKLAFGTWGCTLHLERDDAQNYNPFLCMQLHGPQFDVSRDDGLAMPDVGLIGCRRIFLAEFETEVVSLPAYFTPTTPNLSRAKVSATLEVL